MMRQIVFLVALLALNSSIKVEAKSLNEFYSGEKSKQQKQHPVVGQKYEEGEEAADDPGLDPIVGRNLMSVFLTDIINLVAAPGMTSWFALFFDLFNFAFMPIVGGLVLTSVTYNYDLDQVTYANAAISKADMYASQMRLVKTTIYSGIGKPNFFGDDAAYVPPNNSSFTA